MKERKRESFLKRIFSSLGPGFITGASDDDPSGITTYAQTGAQFGFSQLWMAPFSFPFMTVIQEMCGRIGLVTGKGLSGVIKQHYSKTVLYVAVTLLFVANTINIGANLGAMAASAQLLVDIPFEYLLFFIALLTLSLEIFVSYPAYARILKYFTLSLFAYVITALVIKQDWNAIIISAIVPTIVWSREYILNIVAILGTTISPYLFFWQADEEVEEEIERHQIKAIGVGKPKIDGGDISTMRMDTIVGMFFSNLVMFFIMITAASTLGVNGIRSIETADQAASALRPIAGDFAFLLFALGIIGTGLLAVPILAGSASYAVSEAMNWKAGLSKKFNQAHCFYCVIMVATLVGMLVNFLPIKPFTMLYYTAILNGLCAPPLLVLIMLIGNNKKILGKYTNSRFSNVMGWFITGLMSIAALVLVYTLLAS
jgi:NRAMP (natural resistance-associated macrophage protein)-like metal ion transporter